jgi:hypothetical protein
VLCGTLALVQRRVAGDTACPTKPDGSLSQNVQTPGTGFSLCSSSFLSLTGLWQKSLQRARAGENAYSTLKNQLFASLVE